jgi:hypothetical protein
MALTPDVSVTWAAGPTLNARKRRADFVLMALAITATVFLGFWFSYFGPLAAGTYPVTSPVVHLHGWSFFAWYLLLPLQAALIRVRRVRLHRTLGSLSLALALVMFVTGLIVVGVQMQRALSSAGPSFWSAFGPMIFATLVLFAGFYLAAIVLRRQGAYHKRLIVVAGAAGMGAAAFRILGVVFGPVMWIAPAGILMTNLFIVAGMALDLLREGRVHRAYLIGLLVCLGVEVGAYLSTPTPAGQAIARSLAWVGGTFGFLY